ncbi:MAG: N-acetylglucosamine-6-phosphate deacetylase [Anaerolineae bacterium]
MLIRGRVLFPDGALRDGEVAIEKGVIAEVRQVKEAPAQIISPGWIDLQVNGAFGHDFTLAPWTMPAVAAQLPRTGVTAFLPTIITSPLDTYPRALNTIGELLPAAIDRPGAAARILGLHLEGPYLAHERRGAHNPAFLRTPTVPIQDGLLGPAASQSSLVRLMTLAPELPNALHAIHDLCAQHVVVSLGHSHATYDQAIAGIDAGARYGTHLFNAMSPLQHREPGMVGALLTDPRITVGIIPDGVHFHPSILSWLIRAKGPDHITLVTDAMAAAGLGAGEFALGDRRVIVDQVSARLENGTLAGSILTLDQGVRKLVEWGACSLEAALIMASTTPARVLGLDGLGRIETGCVGDLVVLDQNLDIKQTIIAGEVVA